MTTWRRAAPALVVALALLGCGDDGEEAKSDEPAPTVPLTLPTTEEQILADEPNEPEEVDPDEVDEEPPATTEATPTTLRVGLPPDLGIPGANQISLGSGSTISNTFTVREVAFLEVVAFVQTELEATGWVVQVVPAPTEGAVAFDFTGPGAIGAAEITPQPDGTARVRVVLGGP